MIFFKKLAKKTKKILNLRDYTYFYFKQKTSISDLEKINPEHCIDIIIPILPKDLTILPLCLEGIRENVNHHIKSIYIISPLNEDVIKFCNDHNCLWINENTLFDYKAQDLNIITKAGINRNGWVFQQLIKLHGGIGTQDNYLVIDSDHILIRKHTFIYKNSPVFYQSKENHKPYYQNITYLLDKITLSNLSFVAHKMLFNKALLQKLKLELETKHTQAWDQVILNNLSKKEKSPFYEFELYGNWVNTHEETTLLPWREKHLKYKYLLSFTKLKVRYSDKYKSITFPSHKNKL